MDDAELSGLDLVRKIREMNITPFYIIMITAKDTKDSLLEALGPGEKLTTFVQKPLIGMSCTPASRLPNAR